MSADVFVDTNVLVYARDTTEGAKRERAAHWLGSLWRERRGRLSTQVLQEYYVVVTSKLRPGLPVEDARADVRALTAWDPVPSDPDLMEEAWSLQDEGGFSFWDALIVAAALRAGCALLLTEDLQDGREVRGLRILSPFTEGPDAVLRAGSGG